LLSLALFRYYHITRAFKADKKQLAVFTSFNILANNFLPFNSGVSCQFNQQVQLKD